MSKIPPQYAQLALKFFELIGSHSDFIIMLYKMLSLLKVSAVDLKSNLNYSVTDMT